MASTRGDVELVSPGRVVLAGSFGMEAPSRVAGGAVAASYELAIASGANIVVEADKAGTTGNDLDFLATADGHAKASFDFSLSGLTNLDCTIEFGTAGTGGNSWFVTVVAGSGAGEGVNINEDTTNKVLTVMFEDGVSTVGDFNTAIATTSNFTVSSVGTIANVLAAGADEIYQGNFGNGTPETWAAEAGSPSATTLHFTDSSTTADDAVAALNDLSVGTKMMTARIIDGGTGTHTLASGDAVTKQDLSGGAADSGVKGEGYSVQKTGTGRYRLTYEDVFTTPVVLVACLQLGSVGDQIVIPGSSSLLNIFDFSSGAAADVAVGANNRINWMLLVANTEV